MQMQGTISMKQSNRSIRQSGKQNDQSKSTMAIMEGRGEGEERGGNQNKLCTTKVSSNEQVRMHIATDICFGCGQEGVN